MPKTERQIIDLEENSEFTLNCSIAVPHSEFHALLVQNKILGPDKFGKWFKFCQISFLRAGLFSAVNEYDRSKVTLQG